MNAIPQIEIVEEFDEGALLLFSKACDAEMKKRAAKSGFGDFLHLGVAAQICGKSRERCAKSAE